jgi:hypothetical protein
MNIVARCNSATHSTNFRKARGRERWNVARSRILEGERTFYRGAARRVGVLVLLVACGPIVWSWCSPRQGSKPRRRKRGVWFR